MDPLAALATDTSLDGIHRVRAAFELAAIDRARDGPSRRTEQGPDDGRRTSPVGPRRNRQGQASEIELLPIRRSHRRTPGSRPQRDRLLSRHGCSPARFLRSESRHRAPHGVDERPRRRRSRPSPDDLGETLLLATRRNNSTPNQAARLPRSRRGRSLLRSGPDSSGTVDRPDCATWKPTQSLLRSISDGGGRGAGGRP